MKLPWPGFNEKGSLIIPLEWDEVPFPQKPVYVEGKRFEPKGELHVTVIGKKAGPGILEKIVSTPSIVSAPQEIFEEIDWSFTPADIVRLLSREKKGPSESTIVLEESIVLPLNMPGMKTFYQGLKSRNLVPDNTPVPPPHLTLYTRNCTDGIGVPDEKTLMKLTKKVISVNDLRIQD